MPNKLNIHEIKLNEQPVTNINALPNMTGSTPSGATIGFNNHYMKQNDQPYFGISGEFHFSRYNQADWEDELIKMKMGGINIVSTYVIWIHHEEIKGKFNWKNNLNLRKFCLLCAKHGLQVILRVGPFIHGEVRNGGLPDWLFLDPCTVRSNDPKYLAYVQKYFNEIGQQITGLCFKDDGPIIAVQLDNEFEHASSPWEVAAGTTDEWTPTGKDGADHIAKLKQLAQSAGLETPIYTATAWGGAVAPTDQVLPLWGGYAFWPWIFYDKSVKKHPATPEFIYRIFQHATYNFDPNYDPTRLPYVTCEIGSGMTNFYHYRFKLPAKSVDAIANVKIAGGCNFLGYYMFHGGSNPLGEATPFLNENATPKISYDYQAPISEFGEVRDSFRRLKRLHYFLSAFKDEVCETTPQLPEGQESIKPDDVNSLRFSTRLAKSSGFLFINNYQDHIKETKKESIRFKLKLANEELLIPSTDSLTIQPGINCILPFNLKMTHDILLKSTTTQLLTKITKDQTTSYFFFVPEGLVPEYVLKHVTQVTLSSGQVSKTDDETVVHPTNNELTKMTVKADDGTFVNIYTLSNDMALNFWQFEFAGQTNILISNQTILADADHIQVESNKNRVSVQTIDHFISDDLASRFEEDNNNPLLFHLTVQTEPKDIALSTQKLTKDKVQLQISTTHFSDIKDAYLKVNYVGDIGYLFKSNQLVADNFNNGTTWTTGLKHLADNKEPLNLCLYISPIKEGQTVQSDSPMAARNETSKKEIVSIRSIEVNPRYQITII